MELNVHLEAFLRSIALFLSVYITVRWGNKSTPTYDTKLMLFSIFLGLFLNR